MLSRELLRQEPDRVRELLASRGVDTTPFDGWVELDQKRRSTLVELEDLKHRRNEASQKIGKIKQQGGDASQQIAEVSQLKGRIGELEETARALVLASLSEGESRVSNVPPGVAGFAQTLRQLGVDVKASNATLTVDGRGLRSLEASQSVVDVRGAGDAELLLLAALSCQSFDSRVRLSEECVAQAGPRDQGRRGHLQ